MPPALLALALAVADPLGFPTPQAAAPSPQVAAVAPPAAPAPATPARPPEDAATSRTATPALSLPAAGPGLDALILPVAVLLALAIAALVFGRRRPKAARLVQVLETTSLGPKRSLIVARVGDEVLVIGASEAGLQLLSARPASGEARGAEPAARLVAVPDPEAAPEAPRAGVVLGLLSRLRIRSTAGLGRRSAGQEAEAPAGLPAFDALLAESVEDQELRRKLALGRPGSVR